jgi:hypothetical protein
LAALYREFALQSPVEVVEFHGGDPEYRVASFFLTDGRENHGREERLLLSDGAVPVKPAAFKEAVMHHALAKQKKEDCQEECEQELSNSERGWLSSCQARPFRIS